MGIEGVQKYAINLIPMMAFLGQTKTGQNNCCQMGWIGCPKSCRYVAEKAIVIFHFLADFCNSLSSRHEKH